MLNSFLMVVYLGRIPPKEYRRRAWFCSFSLAMSWRIYW